MHVLSRSTYDEPNKTVSGENHKKHGQNVAYAPRFNCFVGCLRAYNSLNVKLLTSSLLARRLQGADGDAEIPVRKSAIEGQALVNFYF